VDLKYRVFKMFEKPAYHLTSESLIIHCENDARIP